MNKKEKVGIFIDGDNFFDMIQFIRSQDGIAIDILELIRKISDGRSIEKSMMLISISPRGRVDSQIHATIMRMRQNGIQVVTITKTSHQEGNVTKYQGYSDCQLVCEIIRYRNWFDTAIIVTRDGDFRHVAKLLSSSFNKKVEGCGITYGLSPHFTNCLDRFWNIRFMVKDDENLIYTGFSEDTTEEMPADEQISIEEDIEE
ncbi:MAG: NYN domain-containing protein [Patescibacteria group bacterium]|nr:NYN domain-containing protein [Patescibacteria group bacterium]